MKIDSITVLHLDIPITEAYELSFGTVESFQTFLVLVRSGERLGIGETTPLYGYNWEDSQSVQQYLMESAPGLIGCDPGEAVKSIMESRGNNYFAATSLCTALEFLDVDLFQNISGTVVPLVGIVSGSDMESILRSIKKQKSQGFRCVKVKVGGSHDVEKDLLKIKSISSRFPELPLRIDANKGYSLEEALYFVDGIQEYNVEEFEQPFPVDAWDDMEVLYGNRGRINMMLDESIDTREELAEAINRGCCNYVKFKLMKHSSVKYMLDLIEIAKAAKLKIIIGNGVASDIGCYHEMLIQAGTGSVLAGEMNGFLKQKQSILAVPLEFRNGCVRIKGAGGTQVNRSVVDQYLVKKETFS
ncbi:MAG TPA: hypothetical protein EYP35_03680 [Desulfobacterales bacterium]|nr:hypothetical protein [Desulfobacterales bacterium]HIP39617.1 hypothetical protein [Desulfocapsa sulfexigens]